jgi:hypothetical protein
MVTALMAATVAAACVFGGGSELTIHNRTTAPVLVSDQGAPNFVVVDACSSTRFRFGGTGWEQVEGPGGPSPAPRDIAVVTIQALPPPDSSGRWSAWVITHSGVTGYPPEAVPSLPPCEGPAASR